MTVQKLLHWRMEKLNAEAHIDEIIKTSEDKNKGRPNIPDENNLYGDMAKDGWRYREVYLMDHDGKYYRYAPPEEQPKYATLADLEALRAELTPKKQTRRKDDAE